LKKFYSGEVTVRPAKWRGTHKRGNGGKEMAHVAAGK
jgi:hypothetical protein